MSVNRALFSVTLLEAGEGALSVAYARYSL